MSARGGTASPFWRYFQSLGCGLRYPSSLRMSCTALLCDCENNVVKSRYTKAVLLYNRRHDFKAK